MIFAIALLSGCGTKIIDTYCINSKEIVWESQQELDETPINIVKQIVIENEKIGVICKNGH